MITAYESKVMTTPNEKKIMAGSAPEALYVRLTLPIRWYLLRKAIGKASEIAFPLPAREAAGSAREQSRVVLGFAEGRAN